MLASVVAAAIVLPLAMHESGGQPKKTPPRNAAVKPAVQTPDPVGEAMREARRTGKDVEITGDRTAHSTTWAQPDGLLRTRTYNDTIRAKVGGVWKKIDTRLQRVEGGYAPAAVNNPLLFSAGSEGPGQRASRASSRRVSLAGAEEGIGWSELVRMEVEGHELVVSWPGPLPVPVIDGPRALYENVRPDIDLLLTARDGGYSHVLIVHTAEAAKDPVLADLDYRLTSSTLTFKLDPDSNVVRALDPAGQEMAASPTPYLWDSAGEVKATLDETASTPSPEPQAGPAALALPGLAGPQPGSHDAVLDATFDADGVLDLAVDTRLLQDPDVVYPVFIDPTFVSHKIRWTLLYDKYPNSSFLNGQNFNDGTTEARVGYESTTQATSRSVFNFEHPMRLHGATINESWIHFLQTYSWGCSSRQYNLYMAGTVTSASDWNSPPSQGRLIGSHNNGHGYQSGSCPDDWVATNFKSFAQEGANEGWGGIGISLRAANEGDTNAWKKFMGNGEYSPYIDTTYNHTPEEPYQTAMRMTPGGMCDVTAPFPSIGKTDVTFRVTGRLDDGFFPKLNLKIWPTGDVNNPIHDATYAPNSDGAIAVTLPWSRFTSNKTYSWSARSLDTEGGISAFGPPKNSNYCQFFVDQNAPASPDITSVVFPEPGDDMNVWSTVEFGTAGNFTFNTNPRDTGVIRYEYNLNTPNSATAIEVATTQGAAQTRSLKPPMAGANTLYAWAIDTAGNRSQPAKYHFYVTPRKVTDPLGDTTGDTTPDLLAIDALGNLRNYPSPPGGDVNVHMPAAYNATGLLDDGYWGDTATTHALISHAGDWYPGDGVNDIIARMPDGKLYLYPGDGYGSFNTDDRLDILLPAGSPSPATLTELTVTGDVTGDGLTDAFAVSGDQLWAFTGYTGGSFTSARLLAANSWSDRDIVNVADVTGDNVADLVFRGPETERGLLLRHGKAATGGGLDLNSISIAANSGTGKDEVYGTTGWSATNIPMIKGTPDVTADGIPDLWAVKSDGTLHLYKGGRTTHGTATLVGEGGWTTGIHTLG
ncbi:FG-GAP repeat domain-containing protein [Streptomyces hydrogenans]